MNLDHDKKILFNKSTLWSLKAELLKKQGEVNDMKQLSHFKLENFKPASVKPSDAERNSKKEKKTLKDNLKAVDIEELEACRKTKAILEKKAELYEHLSDGAGNSELAERFLVDFNTKKQQENKDTLALSDVEEFHAEDDSDWAEFTDCLGRTRRCLKSDLEMYKKKDHDLIRVITKENPNEVFEKPSNQSEEPDIERPLLFQNKNDYLQSLREKWEQKERDLLAKDKDVHYQDLLFDEARTHGVAYYSFSTNESERHKQMDELKKRREETLKAQQDTEEMRKQREELMAARVAAARARQRARAGLPPEEPKVGEKDFTTCLLEFLTQQKDEADVKAKEKEKKIREENERERQKLREAYVREWDIGKEGVEAKTNTFRELTQEEYVEQQRAKRIEEFAPPQTLSRSKSDFCFDGQGKMKADQAATSAPVKTWADLKPNLIVPPPPDIGDISEPKGLYFSTAKKSVLDKKSKNFIKPQESIINELQEVEPQVDKRKRNIVSNHAEIAPPPTFDYYGPVAKNSRKQKPFESNITEAYAQGAKTLEPKVSTRRIPKNYDFTFD